MFKSLLVFGDSLSDNGLQNGHGFDRYSNGPVWPEYLADLMRAGDLDVRAYGGATSGRGNYNEPAPDWSGLLWQVDQYKPGPDVGETLTVVEIGFNDLHDASFGVSPEQAVGNLAAALDNLADKGLRRFLVWDLYTSPTPPGFLDESYEEYPRYQGQWEKALHRFEEFNRLLKPALAGFRETRTDTDIHLFEASRVIPAISETFEDQTSPWPGTGHLAKAGKWFWYDHWHFTTGAHYAVALEIHRLLLQGGLI